MTRKLDVAILGMGCRFPGARGLDAFAERLLDGHDAITEVPRDRWDADAIYDADLLEPMRASTRWGGFIDDVDRFDAAFFGIGAPEALAMDPQQRVLLETTWEAFEDAHVRPSSVRGARGGVWIAVSHDEYAQRALHHPEGQNAYAATGTEISMTANRISRWLDWSGPSLAINTGCSSALVALEQAVRALDSHEVDVALVGAVSIQLEPGPTIALSQAWMMAADGRCKTFDESADGYVRSEGCGVLLLRRAARPKSAPTSPSLETDVHARVRGYVRGIAVGYGSGSSVTTPNPHAQAEVMRRALEQSGACAPDVTFIEAHGVGTRRGDAAEMEALHAIYGASDVPCALGSVKTQVGHLEWASGMPAIARALVALEHGIAAPHLHLSSPSPELRLSGSRFFVPKVATSVDPRFAAVSSFGLGGTLAHAILERGEATSEPLEECLRAHVVRVTAADPDALRELAARYAEALRRGTRLADLARTSVEARDVLGWVAHVAGKTSDEVIRALESVEPKPARAAPKLAMLFTGQGAQRAGMGRALLALDPTHEMRVEALASGVRDALLRDEAPIDPTELAQPSLFVFEACLAETLRRYGLHPDAVLGHSVGEYAAAVRVGALCFDDGLALVSERGRLMGSLPPRGGMLAVVTDEATLAPHLARFSGALDLAAVNAPGRLVVSGDVDALDRLESELEAAEIPTQRLRVSHAFHSAHMEPILDDFESYAAKIGFRRATLPIARNLDGALTHTIDAPTLRAALRGTVRFADGIQTLAAEGCTVFVEVGPVPTLAAFARRVLGEPTTCLSAFDPRDPELGFARTLATLADLGVSVDLEAFEAERGGSFTTLPSYPFRRTRFWIERDDRVQSTTRTSTEVDVLARLTGPGRVRRVESILRSILEQELGRSIDSEVPFFELGLGSLALVRARAEMTIALGARAPSVPEVFAYPTLRALARFVAERGAPSSTEVSCDAPRPVGRDEPIAIVGVSLRLPGGVIDLASFFDVLCRAEPLAREAPERGLAFPACWLDDVARFDAAHFGIAPDEAAAIDPQQRWLLEASWHALEDAGRPISALDGSATGVFFGLLSNDYGRLVESRRPTSAHGLVGNLASAAAGRVAHAFGFRGPTMVVDTACSSSLVALHLAAESIRRGECTLALAGGASLILDARGFEALTHARALASDGRSKTFSAAADGYGRGEGVLVFVLAPLADARARRDRILGVLLASGVGHDGRAAGLTAPSGDAQRALISAVHARAEVFPEEIDLVECHGTGTPLGDPIEVDALSAVLGGVRRATPLALGAAKAIVGHAEAAAGAVGVAKVLACFAHDAIPPQPLPGGLHPELALDRLAAEVPRVLRPWTRERRRVAAVSAFGMSGTNAHVVLADAYEEADRLQHAELGALRPQHDEQVDGAPTADTCWLALSASNDEALRELARVHVTQLARTSSFVDHAAASRTRRSPQRHRLAVFASDPESASDALEAWLDGRPDDRLVLDGAGESSAHAWLRGESIPEPLAPYAELPLTPLRGTRCWVDPVESDPSPQMRSTASLLADATHATRATERVVPLDSLGVVRELVTPVARSARAWRRLGDDAWLHDDLVVLDARPEEALVFTPDVPLVRAVARVASLARFAVATSPTLPLVVVLPDDPTDLRDAAVAAALRVIRHEHPELDVTTLRIAPSSSFEDALTRWSTHRLPPEVVVAKERFHQDVIDRVHHRPVARAVRSDEVVSLVAIEPGFLDEVRLVTHARPPRARGEVRIRVDSTALSFLDAMRASGLLDDPRPASLGVEVLGHIVEADDLPAGMPCVALAPDGAASEVVVPRELVIASADAAHVSRLHGHLLSELVATEVFDRLAPWIGAEHRVLVQSATGAIGRALVHRAQERGATVLATAGDDARRGRAKELGAAHVFPSRHDGWCDALLAATDGEGVDLVVSSTAGEGATRALEVLRDGGIVVDLDRRSGRVTTCSRDNRTLARLDVLSLARHSPTRIAAAFRALATRVTLEGLPPTPFEEAPITDAPRVLRAMAQAQHDGKRALRFDAVTRAEPDSWRASSEGTYVITGGLGALGLATARWLVARGARSLVLLSRRPPDEPTRVLLDALRTDADVRTEALDVTDAASVRSFFDSVPSVLGIFHAAGVLDDGLVEAQTSDRIARVLAPKLAAEALDAHAPHGLELFVLYGSVAGSLGNPGQLAYAAANAALTALAARRRARGEHALCVDWGPWAEAGMAASLASAHTAHGARPLEATAAFARLERALASDATHTLELDADLVALTRAMPTLRARLSDRLLPPERPRDDVWAVELRALTPEARRDRATRVLRDLVSGLHVGPLDDDTPLALDSLAAVELRERVRSRLGLSLPAAAFLRGTPRALADVALATLGLGLATEARPEPIVALRRAKSPRARLLCLPFAGGDPRIFRAWPDHLPDDVDVLAVELPGRGARHAEAPHSAMAQVIDELVDAVLPELDRPLVIFGHCMGALVGYELARALDARGRRVAHLVASACPGPNEYAVPALCRATRRYDRALTVGAPGIQFEPVHTHDELGLAEVLRFLGYGPTRHLLADPELRAALMPTIRADFEVCGTYLHHHAAKLHVPVTLLAGDQDPFASPAEVARWREVVDAEVSSHVLRGDHYFLFPEATAVFAAVRAAISLRAERSLDSSSP